MIRVALAFIVGVSAMLSVSAALVLLVTGLWLWEGHLVGKAIVLTAAGLLMMSAATRLYDDC